jgi:hypothetical protein
MFNSRDSDLLIVQTVEPATREEVRFLVLKGWRVVIWTMYAVIIL